MRAGLALLLLAAQLASAAPARAGEPPATRLPTWEQSHTLEGNQTVRTLRAFGYCLVRARASASEALMASRPGSAEESAAMTALSEGDDHPCLYQATRMVIRSRPLIRGIVAEFLYNRDNPGSRNHAPRAFDRPFDPAAPGWRETPDGALGRWLAACAVHRGPGHARQMIRFNHDSPGETRALRAIRPALLHCLPQGRSLQVSRHVIRAMLAEALLDFSRGN